MTVVAFGHWRIIFSPPAAYAVYAGKFSMWRGTGFWVSLRWWVAQDVGNKFEL